MTVDEHDLDPDPLRQFERWLEHARDYVAVPEAVALATATSDGRPSARMVLLKGADERGFGFYTNSESRKARELTQNPRAALLFHWQPLGRQVRVEGSVEPVSSDEAAEYFRTRPGGGRGTGARCRRTGAASGSSPTRTSSGSTATTACTTASATNATPSAGRESGSLRELSGAERDPRKRIPFAQIPEGSLRSLGRRVSRSQLVPSLSSPAQNGIRGSGSRSRKSLKGRFAPWVGRPISRAGRASAR